MGTAWIWPRILRDGGVKTCCCLCYDFKILIIAASFTLLAFRKYLMLRRRKWYQVLIFWNWRDTVCSCSWISTFRRTCYFPREGQSIHRRWRHNFCPKCLYPPEALHGVTSQETAFPALSFMKTPTLYESTCRSVATLYFQALHQNS